MVNSQVGYFIQCLLEFLQVQANRAYVKEIQVNQVSCASDLWSIKYLSSQDNSGMYSIRHNDGSCVTGSIQVSGTNKKEARLLDSDFFQGKCVQYLQITSQRYNTR